ncbi:MAG TPA: homocysteine S-methyltransferase family protein, partial [Candidatus Limnocylindria bacterium]|nr:homocysteine S-methyltransferase family protein [Candidatus Limnocylindria bacterium]
MNPTRRDTPFREAMRSLLVFDGAMGSLLYERGVFVTQNFEQLNVTRPDVVRKIHEDYIAAGAQVVETNTFGANTFCLDRHGLGDQVRAYNLAGARLARTAAGEDAWVAGSIGPTGLVPGVATRAELDQVAATFAEQATTLAEGGVDLFVLETFRHLEEIRIAIEAARRAAPGLPIIASMTFDASESVADGSTPEQVATTLRDWGADGIGVNCGDGPQLALAIAERLRGAGLPLSVQPNAGLPRTVDGRLLYMATPEYLDVFARRTIQLGATMVGGCCGTTPDHVRWMAKSSRMLGDKHTEVVRNRPITA